MNTGLLCYDFKKLEDPINWEDIQNTTHFKDEAECFKYFRGCSNKFFIIENWALYNMCVRPNSVRELMFDSDKLNSSIDFIYKLCFSNVPKHIPIEIVIGSISTSRLHDKKIKHVDLFFLEESEFRDYKDLPRNAFTDRERIVRNGLRRFVNLVKDEFVSKFNRSGHNNVKISILYSCSAFFMEYLSHRGGYYISDKSQLFFDRLHNAKRNRCINTNRNVLQYDKSPTDLKMGDDDMPYLYGNVRRVAENLGQSYSCYAEYLKMLDERNLTEYCVAKYPDD